MSASFFRRPAARAWLVVGAALAACPALASDKPATQAGAEKLQALFDRFLPAKPAGSPAFVTVKSGGEDYVVSADLGALNGLLAAVGATASYEPATLVYKLFEQDDGMWRLVQDSIPKSSRTPATRPARSRSRTTSRRSSSIQRSHGRSADRRAPTRALSRCIRRRTMRPSISARSAEITRRP